MRRRVALMRAPMVCAESGCPEPAVYRGRCAAHRWRPSTWPQRKRARQVRSAGRAHLRAVRRVGPAGLGHASVPPGSGTVDHVVPLAEGGRDDLSNLQLL
jgi:hypothetical protein